MTSMRDNACDGDERLPSLSACIGAAKILREQGSALRQQLEHLAIDVEHHSVKVQILARNLERHAEKLKCKN